MTTTKLSGRDQFAQRASATLAHLSETNNDPALAEGVARDTLHGLGLARVRVLTAAQDEVLPNLKV